MAFNNTNDRNDLGSNQRQGNFDSDNLYQSADRATGGVGDQYSSGGNLDRSNQCTHSDSACVVDIGPHSMIKVSDSSRDRSGLGSTGTGYNDNQTSDIGSTGQTDYGSSGQTGYGSSGQTGAGYGGSGQNEPYGSSKQTGYGSNTDNFGSNTSDNFGSRTGGGIGSTGGDYNRDFDSSNTTGTTTKPGLGDKVRGTCIHFIFYLLISLSTFSGTAEKVAGKVTRDPNLVERGQERKVSNIVS
jgi:hypothetical protein